MIWIFTEDMNGRNGCLGSFESRVRAQQVADDYTGITYIKDYPTGDRAEAKRYFRGEKAKKEGLEAGYKNVANLNLSELEEDE